MKKLLAALLALVLVFAAVFVLFGSPLIYINNARLRGAIADTDSSTVRLNELTPFEWDALYTFAPYTSVQEIESAVGASSPTIRQTVSEGMTQLIFVKGGAVVCAVTGYPSNVGFSASFESPVLYDDDAQFALERTDGVARLSLI